MSDGCKTYMRDFNNQVRHFDEMAAWHAERLPAPLPAALLVAPARRRTFVSAAWFLTGVIAVSLCNSVSCTALTTAPCDKNPACIIETAAYRPPVELTTTTCRDASGPYLPGVRYFLCSDGTRGLDNNSVLEVVVRRGTERVVVTPGGMMTLKAGDEIVDGNAELRERVRVLEDKVKGRKP